jgi:hypothetical protein
MTFGGAASIQYPTMKEGTGPIVYSVQLSLSGLPPGVTATVSPQTLTVGQTVSISLIASSTAPEAQNVPVTLTGTANAPITPVTVVFLLDVTPSAGLLPDNRTDYLSTEDTPFGAVYDPVHNLIFSSNNSWNRVEVISTTTHTFQTRIPLPEPRGIDISQDNSTVWVATGSHQVFAINTSSLAVTNYQLPPGSPSYWEGYQVLALADGTLMLEWTAGMGTGSFGLAIWNPTSNQLTSLTLPDYDAAEFFLVIRSGDGTRVYFIDQTSAGSAFYYDVLAKSFSNVVTLGGYATGAAVNRDGSQVMVCDMNGANLYNENWHILSWVPPGCGPIPLSGGSIFSPDGRYLYQEVATDPPLISKFDTGTFSVVSVAPAMPFIPVEEELSQLYWLPTPFGVDSSGMVFGIQEWGIAFDDSAYAQNYVAVTSLPDVPSTPAYMNFSPNFGPLSGGTASGGFGNVFKFGPTVWYGNSLGTSTLDSSGSLTITSPASDTPGLANVKMIFPDGVEVFDALSFSYGPTLQYAYLSGGSPQGGVPGEVIGYGLPGDAASATLSIGSSSVNLGTPPSGGLPYVGPPFPNKILDFTTPSGAPGWADITVNTADGTSKLSKAFFYAKSVQDYASTDTFTAVLYDSQRQQLYLSAGNHIDVFSLTANQFTASLNPPATGTSKQFTGLALTTDNSMLLAADLLDGSLAVISPDNSSNNYVIPVTPAVNVGSSCPLGPLYVAAGANNQALVVTGGLPGLACGPRGVVYVVNLAARTVGPLPAGNCPLVGSAGYLSASTTGQEIAIGAWVGGPATGFCIYNSVTQTYVSNPYLSQAGAAMSGDGQIAASQYVLTDGSANLIGRVSRPDPYYWDIDSGASPIYPLEQPQLNAAGSLYYMAYPNFIEVIDVRHGLLRLRFSLSETVSDTAAPMAIDPGGRFIYLITNQGLTVVDLGEAPLSIGWLNSATAAPGGQVAVRGSGFNTSTTATVGGQAAAVTVSDENTLTLTVPNINSGPAAIVLTNSDGTSYTVVGLLTIQ